MSRETAHLSACVVHRAQERDQATHERDEARKAAQALFRLFRRELDAANWLELYPWLQEGADREPAA